jgi:oxalate decarboxylase/phosphoglucose isomerase-like protein (cupin superfamily)
VLRRKGKRWVPIPHDFVLEGKNIMIIQEPGGEITIHAISRKGRKALVPFNPFHPWKDED